MKYGKELKEMSQSELIARATEIEEDLMFMFEKEFTEGQLKLASSLMKDLYQCGFRCGLLCNEQFKPKGE